MCSMTVFQRLRPVPDRNKTKTWSEGAEFHPRPGQVRTVNPFYKEIYAIVDSIPYGKVISYGDIAKLLGRPRAAREVGWAMSCCPEHLPWQRVVMASGAVTGGVYAEIRRAILESEGVEFLPDGRVDMAVCRWLGTSKQASTQT